MPVIPDPVFSIASFTFTKPLFIMVLFAILMILAAVSMIRKSKISTDTAPEIKYNYPIIFLEGLLVGGITGLVGAGGGFLIIPALVLLLIIPALVLLARLPMKQAVGTSLLIIALKSLVGFTGDLDSGYIINYTFLFMFSAFAVAGILAGSYLARFISGNKLKVVFGWFVLVMGTYILGKELLF